MMQLLLNEPDNLAPYGGVILHIPHAATDIPDPFLEDYCISERELEREKLRLTDWYTDELFGFEDESVEIVRFPFSRLLVDPERFRDDRNEPMAKLGMGALYSRGSRLQRIRPFLTPQKQALLLAIYDDHHRKLEQAVQRALDRYGCALIVDCHSFPEYALPCHQYNSPCLLGFGIGTDPFHTPEALKTYFGHNLQRSNNSLVAIDQPFSGSLVPSRYYLKDSRVHSIMIEINRSIYMNELSRIKKPEPFKHLQAQLKRLIKGCIKKT